MRLLDQRFPKGWKFNSRRVHDRFLLFRRDLGELDDLLILTDVRLKHCHQYLGVTQARFKPDGVVLLLQLGEQYCPPYFGVELRYDICWVTKWGHKAQPESHIEVT